MPKYNTDMLIKDVFAVPEFKAIVVKHIPNIDSIPMMKLAQNKTADQIKNYIPSPNLKDKFEKIIAELKEYE